MNHVWPKRQTHVPYLGKSNKYRVCTKQLQDIRLEHVLAPDCGGTRIWPTWFELFIWAIEKKKLKKDFQDGDWNNQVVLQKIELLVMCLIKYWHFHHIYNEQISRLFHWIHAKMKYIIKVFFFLLLSVDTFKDKFWLSVYWWIG